MIIAFDDVKTYKLKLFFFAYWSQFLQLFIALTNRFAAADMSDSEVFG